MEARLLLRVVAAAMATIGLLAGATCTGAEYATPNFVIKTASPQLAEQFGKVAEKLRRELAIEWTGQAMPDWSRPCPVTVQVGERLGAGGATRFVFNQGEVYDWHMNIQGSAQRVIDSVLPHEILHMVFATHFRQPLPRWADEGAATTVEHSSEQIKHKQKLIEFLQSGRGIAFNQLFAMMDYPPAPNDPMPLYAHGYSLADYLIQQGGRRRYVQFIEAGLKDHRWSAAVERFYGKHGLGDLQTQWVAWVAQGSPTLAATPLAAPNLAAPSLAAASLAAPPLAAPKAAVPLDRYDSHAALAVKGSGTGSIPTSTAASTTAPAAASTGDWLPAQRQPRPEPNLVVRDEVLPRSVHDNRPLELIRRNSDPNTRLAARRTAPVDFDTAFTGQYRPRRDSEPAASPERQIASQSAPVDSTLSRPQPVESPGQIVLEAVGRP